MDAMEKEHRLAVGSVRAVVAGLLALAVNRAKRRLIPAGSLVIAELE
jgi:hypothetical protein